QEMDSRKVAILGRQAEVRALGAADQEGIMAGKREGLALVGAADDGQRDAHGLSFRSVLFEAPGVCIMPAATMALKRASRESAALAGKDAHTGSADGARGSIRVGYNEGRAGVPACHQVRVLDESGVAAWSFI